MSSPLGHCHSEITKTIQSACMDLYHLSSCMRSTPIIGLADELISILPHGLDKVMFLSTGGEANEAALRTAKLYTGR
jgi:4-aminobutyrate aminotransferase-like enzyme